MAKKQSGESDQYREIDAAIKAGSFSSIYVFYGAELYLLERYRLRLKAAVVAEGMEDFNYHRFDEENWDVSYFSDAVNSVPLMSDRTFVELIDIDPFKMSEYDREDVTQILSAIPDTTVVLFVFRTIPWKPDGRKKKLSSLFQEAKTVEFMQQQDSVLIRWIGREFAKAGLEISRAHADHLLQVVGRNMSDLDTEMQKIISYSEDEAAVSEEVIDEVATPTLEMSVFQMTNLLGEGKIGQAVESLRELVEQDNDPIAINALIGRQYRQMLCAKILMEKGKSYTDLMHLFRMQQYGAKTVFRQAQRFSREYLKYAVQTAAEADLACKSSDQDNSKILEDMLLQIGMKVRG